MTVASSSEFFVTANARFRSPTVVARSFVPPEQFRELARPSHTVLIGPRGSGKTTLLKMLTPEALSEASQTRRFRLESGLRFTGVFIPSDIAWSKQLQTFSRWNLPQDISTAIFEASFTISVLRSFAGALHDRFKQEVPQTWSGLEPVDLNSATESLIAESLADIWSLNLRVPSLRGLKAAAAEKIVELGRVAAQIHRTSTSVDLDGGLLLGPLIPQLTLALDTIEAIVPEIAGEKWGLLFDELELAPVETRQSLISSMRSVDDRLIFKLAIAPYASDLSQLMSAVSAMPGHDHQEIWLSYGHKSEAMNFSYELMRALVREKVGQNVSLSSLLGDALFPEDDEDGGLEPAPNELSKAQEGLVRELDSNDASFHKHVERVAGSVDKLLNSTGQNRSQNLRKILPLVVVRVAFRTPDRSDAMVAMRRTRTRKNPEIYAGMTALAAILEGNPRWIIGVLTALLDEPTEKISAALQNAEIARTRNTFRAMLSTIPVPISNETKRGLLSLLDSVGGAFRKSVIVDDFSADPVASFVVDNSASPALIDALGSAINAGAIVYVPDATGAGILSSMKGKRFRLSYLLATQYQLPLRLERAGSLRAILSHQASATPLELFAND